MSDITAALGLSLETMSKEELDGMKEATHLILQGVSGNYHLLDHARLYNNNKDSNTDYVRYELLLSTPSEHG